MSFALWLLVWIATSGLTGLLSEKFIVDMRDTTIHYKQIV